MRFQILSHAGLAVYGAHKTLVCDPWLVGSCYWRSWWNYPPTPPSLIRELRPDVIYLTHIHWDHFHGPSLRRFSQDTPILVPKGNYDRIRRDLNRMGFHRVSELRHGQSVDLDADFRVTSYQFGVFLDSALVIECEGVVMLNANDAKFMGAPLGQILRRHPRIDFVLRSHSSANSSSCFEVVDRPAADVEPAVDRPGRFDRARVLQGRGLDIMNRPSDGVSQTAVHVREFADFAKASGARYAIPFASNHCHLHRDVYAFNEFVQTPAAVAEHFRQQNIADPQLQIMAPGDSWSKEEGFRLSEVDLFVDRMARLAAYQESKRCVLERYYEREARAVVRLAEVQSYFRRFCAACPYLLRRSFRKKPLIYVLWAGDRRTVFLVNLGTRDVQELETIPENAEIVIVTTTLIMRQCLKLGLFSHLGLSRRVRYRFTSRSSRDVQRLILLFSLYEHDWLPVRRAFKPRVLETYALRWREVYLYLQWLRDIALRGQIDLGSYLRFNRNGDDTISQSSDKH